MGYYENQLKALTSGPTSIPAWQITELDRLTAEMDSLQSEINSVAASPGWTGASADLARENLSSLRKLFGEIEAGLVDAKSAIDSANRAMTRADNAYATLPGTAIPSWIYDEVSKATAGAKIWVPFVGEFKVETVISRVQEFFGAQRESAAYAALVKLQAELRAPRAQLAASKTQGINGNIEWVSAPEEPIGDEPSWSGDDNGYGGWGSGGGFVSGGSGGGNGGGTTVSPPWPPRVIPENPPPGWPRTTIGIDGEVRPGSLNGGSGGGSLSGLGGGGLGAGLVGAGAGGAALLAGSKLASGGASMFGGAGAGAGAGGGKSTSAMMGGGAPGGGGGSEKEKRNGLGLIAPKLEDDDEMGPRAAAAGAGGRD